MTAPAHIPRPPADHGGGALADEIVRKVDQTVEAILSYTEYEDDTEFAENLQADLIALARLATLSAGSAWQQIESAPKKKRILACIWHGDRYFVVTARWASGSNAWVDEREDSCVGHVIGRTKQPGYYQLLPASPQPQREDARARDADGNFICPYYPDEAQCDGAPCFKCPGPTASDEVVGERENER